MIVLKLTSPNGQPVTVIIGNDGAVAIPHQMKPQGDFEIGKSKMIEGTQLFVGARHVIVLESVEAITKAIGQTEAALTPGYQTASYQ